MINPPKTIAIVLPNLHAGGAERVAIALMHGFRAAGHRVEFVLMQAEGALLEEVPADVRVIDLKATRVRSAIRPLIRYFRNTPPRAAQVSMWPLTVGALIAAKVTRASTRVVVSDHTTVSKHLAAQPVTRRLLGWSVRLFYPWAAARVSVANGVADDFARLSGLPRESFTVIYNPVDGPPDRADPSSHIDDLWGDADDRIITVGSLKAEKNHRLLLRSFARLRPQGAAKLMIVGSGSLDGELKRLAASLGIADDVIFTGFVAQPWAHYLSADLFVLSSDHEGYPLVLIEAMRCGLRVVSTDCDNGPREILDGGKYGTLVPVGDEAALAAAMAQALDEPHSAEGVTRRADDLSGAEPMNQYLEMMLTHPR